MSIRPEARHRVGVRRALTAAGAALVALALAACASGSTASGEPVNLVDTGA
jgi:ABC-type proline/glycine betaine transport system substrate-binding protein